MFRYACFLFCAALLLPGRAQGTSPTSPPIAGFFVAATDSALAFRFLIYDWKVGAVKDTVAWFETRPSFIARLRHHLPMRTTMVPFGPGRFEHGMVELKIKSMIMNVSGEVAAVGKEYGQNYVVVETSEGGPITVYTPKAPDYAPGDDIGFGDIEIYPSYRDNPVMASLYGPVKVEAESYESLYFSVILVAMANVTMVMVVTPFLARGRTTLARRRMMKVSASL